MKVLRNTHTHTRLLPWVLLVLFYSLFTRHAKRTALMRRFVCVAANPYCCGLTTSLTGILTALQSGGVPLHAIDLTFPR